MTQTDLREKPLTSSSGGDTGTAPQGCQICGNRDFRTKTLIIDARTGERPANVKAKLLGGIVLNLFGLTCLILGIALVIDPLPSNVGNSNHPIYYIGIGLIALWNGIALVRSSVRGHKVEVTRPECSVCFATWEQTGLFHKNRRHLAWANVLFVLGGFLLISAVSGLISGLAEGHNTGLGQTIIGALLVIAIAGPFILAGVLLRRRAGRFLDRLKESVKVDGDYYHCECGRPKYPYYWAHVALCLTFYGLVSLLFPLKKCPKCRTPYVAVAQSKGET